MHNRYFQKIAYFPLVALVIGWAMFASVARGSPVGVGTCHSPPIYQEEAVPPGNTRGQPAESGGWNFQAEAADLLGEIRSLSTDLNREADSFRTFVRTSSSYDGQAL
ncbi:MAG: hypothetical protein KGM47_06985, partial [Acidobacteriota bacterium]|nr:hypothetical protein [Acidobacteriota bacterium]